MFIPNDIDKFIGMEKMDRWIYRAVLTLLVIFTLIVIINTAMENNFTEFVKTLPGTIYGMGLLSSIAIFYVLVRSKTKSITTFELFRVKLRDDKLNTVDRTKIQDFLFEKAISKNTLLKYFSKKD